MSQNRNVDMLERKVGKFPVAKFIIIEPEVASWGVARQGQDPNRGRARVTNLVTR